MTKESLSNKNAVTKMERNYLPIYLDCFDSKKVIYSFARGRHITITRNDNQQSTVYRELRRRYRPCHSENRKAVPSQGEPRDGALNFDTNRILQRHRAVSLLQHGFLAGLCLQTAVNHLSTRSPMLRSARAKTLS